MGKLTKIILLVFSSLLVLIIAAVVIIPLAVDLNDYKPEIEAAVKDKTGRTLSIGGDIDVSVFPWIGISTGELSLSNAAGFTEQNFVLIGESDIKVKLMPLLSKKIEVSTIVLKGLELHLAKDKQGVSNWDDLSKPAEGEDQKDAQEDMESEPDASEFDISTVAVGGLVLENAHISWDDQQAGQHVVIKELNLSSSAVVFNEPIALEFAFFLENAEPAVTEKLALSTDLIIDETLQKIQLRDFKLNSVTRGEMIPGGVFDAELLSTIVLDLQEQTLALSELQLNTNLIDLTADLNVTQLNSDLQYAGAISLASFNPKALMQQLQMALPETSDKQVLQKLAMDFSLQGTTDSVTLKDLKITLDDTKIEGGVGVKQFNNPAISFQLAVDEIDIDRYSAAKKVAAKSESGNAAKTASGAPVSLIPVDTIRGLNVAGDLSIEKLKVAQLKMQGVALNVQAKQGALKTRHSIRQLYKGQYQGQISINAKPKVPTIALNEKISNIQIEPLLTDLTPGEPAKMKGTANIVANLNTRGHTVDDFKSALAGNLGFSLKKGAVNGFNLQQIIDVGKLTITGKQMQQNYTNEQTLFSIIKGTATIKKGVVNNPDFLAKSSDADIKGAGTVNLVNEALNYKVMAQLKKDYNKSKVKLSGRSIEINVAGTIGEPTYTTNLMSLMSEKEKQKVDKLVGKGEKEIDKALGKGTGKAVNKLLKSFF